MLRRIAKLLINNFNFHLHWRYERLTAFAREIDVCLVIDGGSLQICLDNYKIEFIEFASKAPSVVCCRCSPTQKAEIVKLIREHTKRRTAAIGDGGNDVSMIQAAYPLRYSFFFFFDYVSDVGLGIVGKEGKQASLAADFSITQFSFISRLISSNYYYLRFCFDCLYILWHGRNSYHRTARLSQFVIHRGLIITFIQCVFSSVSIQFVAVVDFFYSSRYSTLPLLQYSMECWWSDTVHSTPISLCFLLFWMRMLVNL